MSVEQLDIFAELGGRPVELETGPWECPECGSTWPNPDQCAGGRRALVDFHMSTTTTDSSAVRAGVYPLGRCRSQGIALDFLHLRRADGRRQYVDWDSDLLELILDARARGCDEGQIAAALAQPWDQGDLP